MIKKSIYPKTERIKDGKLKTITEKVDGSNLVFFKMGGELYIAQRNNIYLLGELEQVKGKIYKGLYQWLLDNGKHLLENLNDCSAICGEWVGMGQIGYGDTFEHKFSMFDFANIDEDLIELKTTIYKHDLFIYPFVEQVIPKYIGVVNVILETDRDLSIEELDKLFASQEVILDRKIEGFVIYEHASNSIKKYVRRKGKGGVLQDHLVR